MQFFAVLLILLSQSAVFIVDNVIHNEYKQSSEFILSTMELRNLQYTINTIFLDVAVDAKPYITTDPFDRSRTVDWLLWNIDQQNRLMKKISGFKEDDLPPYMRDFYKIYLDYQLGDICKLGLLRSNPLAYLTERRHA